MRVLLVQEIHFGKKLKSFGSSPDIHRSRVPAGIPCNLWRSPTLCPTKARAWWISLSLPFRNPEVDNVEPD